MSNTTPGPNFNPYSAPAVAVEANPQQPWIQLAQYRTVRLGLQLIYYSIAAMAGFMILLLVSSIFLGAGNLISAVLVGLGFIVAALVSVIGFCMCAACPNPNEKTLAFSSILCLMINVAGTLLSSLLPVFAVNEPLLVFSAVVSIAGSIANFVGSILFCLLLKRIGSNISSDPMKRNAQSALNWFLVLTCFVVLFVAGAFFLGTMFAGGGRPGGIEIFIGIFALVMIVLGLITFFKFLSMLRTGINELDSSRHAQT